MCNKDRFSVPVVFALPINRVVEEVKKGVSVTPVVRAELIVEGI